MNKEAYSRGFEAVMEKRAARGHYSRGLVRRLVELAQAGKLRSALGESPYRSVISSHSGTPQRYKQLRSGGYLTRALRVGYPEPRLVKMTKRAPKRGTAKADRLARMIKALRAREDTIGERVWPELGIGAGLPAGVKKRFAQHAARDRAADFSKALRPPGGMLT